MTQKDGANAGPFARGKDIGVADEMDLAAGLDPHRPDQRALRLDPPELHTGGAFRVQLGLGEIRSCQQSSGMTPQYLCAAALMIARIAGASLALQRRIFIVSPVRSV